MAQLVRAPPCHGGGREFESLLGRLYGIIAQLGEHLPYKQRVIGSSPIGSICRSGGTGRRPGLKIPWVVIPVPVRFRSAALFFSLRFLWSQCLQESQNFFLCIPFGGKDIIQKITALHLLLRDAMPLFWSLHTFIEKWTWRESNPRPKTCPMYFYYHSQLFNIPSAVRKLTSLRVQ